MKISKLRQLSDHWDLLIMFLNSYLSEPWRLLPPSALLCFTCEVVAQDSWRDDDATRGEKLFQIRLGHVLGQSGNILKKSKRVFHLGFNVIFMTCFSYQVGTLNWLAARPCVRNLENYNYIVNHFPWPQIRLFLLWWFCFGDVVRWGFVLLLLHRHCWRSW